VLQYDKAGRSAATPAPRPAPTPALDACGLRYTSRRGRCRCLGSTPTAAGLRWPTHHCRPATPPGRRRPAGLWGRLQTPQNHCHAATTNLTDARSRPPGPAAMSPHRPPRAAANRVGWSRRAPQTDIANAGSMLAVAGGGAVRLAGTVVPTTNERPSLLQGRPDSLRPQQPTLQRLLPSGGYSRRLGNAVCLETVPGQPIPEWGPTALRPVRPPARRHIDPTAPLLTTHK
jgi:hypothetical protein